MSANDTCDVVILAFDMERGNSPAVELQRVFGIDERAAFRLIDNLPMTVQRGVPPVRAEYFRRALGMIGATVEVRDAQGHVIELPAEAPSGAPPAADEATAATLDGTFPAGDFDQDGAHDALRRTISSSAEQRPAQPTAIAQPAPFAPTAVVVPAIATPADATLREAVPAPVVSAGSSPVPQAKAHTAQAQAQAVAWQMPTALDTANAPARAPIPAVGPAATPGAEPTHFGGAAPALASPARPEPANGANAASDLAALPGTSAGDAGWSGTAELDTLGTLDAALSRPMHNLRSDVWDPPPEPEVAGRPAAVEDAGRAEAGGTPDDPIVIERHRVEHKQPQFDIGAAIPMHDKWEAPGSERAGPPSAMRGTAQSEQGSGLSLDLDGEAIPVQQRKRTAASESRRPRAAKRAAPKPGTDATLDELPSPLAQPPPAKPRARKRRPPPDGAAQRVRTAATVDRRSFLEAVFPALVLPFTGPGFLWLVMVALWSLAVAGIGYGVAFIPILGPFLIFFLNASLVAVTCDYFRASYWSAATGGNELDRAPNLDPVHMIESYLKNGMHPLLFLTASQGFAVYWGVSQAMDGVPITKILGSSVTWGILFLPSFYWPAAVARTAAANNLGAIWNVPAGLKSVFSAPMKYVTVYIAGLLVLLLGVGLCGLLGSLVGARGPLLSAMVGLPMALSHGVMGALMGHLARTTPGALEP